MSLSVVVDGCTVSIGDDGDETDYSCWPTAVAMFPWPQQFPFYLLPHSRYGGSCY